MLVWPNVCYSILTISQQGIERVLELDELTAIDTWVKSLLKGRAVCTCNADNLETARHATKGSAT